MRLFARILVLFVTLGPYGTATARSDQEIDKSQIVRLSVNESLKNEFSRVPLWALKLGFGPQFQSWAVNTQQAPEIIAALKDGTSVPMNQTQIGFLIAGTAAGEEMEIFTSGSLLFKNFKVLKDPSNPIEAAPPNVTRIFVIGATWCAFCKPRTGSILRYFGQADQRTRSPYEIVYLEFSGDQEEVEGSQPVQQFLRAQSLKSGFGYPSVVVQQNDRLLTFEAANDYLNKEVARAKPQINLIQNIESASEFLAISRVMMTSIFTDVGKFETDLIRRFQLAGVLVYRRNAQNFGSDDLRKIFARIQKSSQTPLFVAVDQEGGFVQRIMTTDTCKLPPAEVLEGKSEPQIRRFAEIMARDLLRSGVNMNFNPILDLKDTRSEDITGWKRAISEDPKEVIRVASIVNSVLVENGILTVGKHLPGIGAAKNTHNLPATITGDFKALKDKELAPFLSLMNSPAGLPGIMTGHVTLPAYDSDLPITFSKSTIDRLVRGKMAYQGLLINDGFHMKSSTAYIPEEQAPYFALLAGFAPVYVNANYLRPSISFILKRLSDPNVSEAEKSTFRNALKSAEVRIRKAKLQLSSTSGKLDTSTGCSTADYDFLNELAGSTDWRVQSN